MTGGLPTLSLARQLIVLRLRLLRNALRWRRGRAPALPLLLGLFTSIAYLGLFTQSFGAIVESTGFEGQAAALALVVGAIVTGTLAAKASANEAVVAGSPENEFLLARPVSLPSLLVARSLAEAVTDPFGALFIFPILVAAAMTWRLGAAAWLCAAATSMIVQVGTSALAQAAQIAVVRYTRPERRRQVWVGLRLVAALPLAALWMTGTWVLRAPRALGQAAASMAWWLSATPGAAVARPVVALAAGRAGAAVVAVAALAATSAAMLGLAYAVARRAGMRGWEEAGTPWAETTRHAAAGGGGGGRLLTAATKDLRLLLRDRSQLMKLIAMPIIFVGIQLFGAAGLGWSTASLTRVAALSFSLCLYMATLGPLAHMQAERRAFWILRTVPVPIGRLMAAKARSWSLLLGGLGLVTFAALSAGVPDAGAGERVGVGLLVVAGTAGSAWLAVAFGCQAADLSDDQTPAITPSSIYLFMLIGALYNVLLIGDAATRVRGLLLYVFALGAFWASGMRQAARCLDPESRHLREVRLGDAATFVLVAFLAPRGLAQVAPGRDGVIAGLVVAALIGLSAAGYLARRRRAAGATSRRRRLLGVLAGAALALVAAGAFARDAGELTPELLLVVLVSGLYQELVFRGVLQRSLEDHGPGRGPVARAAVAAATSAMIGFAASGDPLGVAPGEHAVAAVARAATGMIGVAWAARMAFVALAHLLVR